MFQVQSSALHPSRCVTSLKQHSAKRPTHRIWIWCCKCDSSVEAGTAPPPLCLLRPPECTHGAPATNAASLLSPAAATLGTERARPGRMQDARILVAGASGDIGRAIAFVMIEAGAEVIMLGRNVDRLMQGNSLSARIGRRSHQIRYVAVDLTDLAAVSLAGAGIAASGRLDALVLSAGTYQRSQEPEAFRRQIDTNLVGPYALLQACTSASRRQQGAGYLYQF